MWLRMTAMWAAMMLFVNCRWSNHGHERGGAYSASHSPGVTYRRHVLLGAVAIWATPHVASSVIHVVASVIYVHPNATLHSEERKSHSTYVKYVQGNARIHSAHTTIHSRDPA